MLQVQYTTTRIIIEELSEEETGFVILQSNDYHMLFRVTKYTGQEKGDLALQVVKCIKREEHLLAEIPLNTKDLQKNEDQKRLLIELRVSGYGQKADFAYLSDGAFIPVALNVDIHEMSTEVAGGFVGNTLGVYATSGGKLTNNYVDIV